jgi:hypothetical protein
MRKQSIVLSLMPEINNLSSTFDWSQYDVNVNSHIDILSASIYYKSQLAMWIHYLHTLNANLDGNCDEGWVKMN